MKEVHIMRGPPGVGKTRTAKQILEDSALKGVVLSTDDYWREHGYSKAVPYLMGTAHAWNRIRFLGEVASDTKIIIIDNTNSEEWEFSDYVVVGKMFGYKVAYSDLTPDTVEEVVEAAKRNVHDVPISTCISIWERYQKEQIRLERARKRGSSDE